MIVFVLAFIIVMSLVVLVHESGHFLAARKAGVPVYEFSNMAIPAICPLAVEGMIHQILGEGLKCMLPNVSCLETVYKHACCNVSVQRSCMILSSSGNSTAMGIIH